MAQYYSAFNGSATSAAAPFATGDGRDGVSWAEKQPAAPKGRGAVAAGAAGAAAPDAREERPSARGASTLASAGSAIGGAPAAQGGGGGYQATRSQIVFGGGEPSVTSNSGYTRFAGLTSRSSLSSANFGGDGNDYRFAGRAGSSLPAAPQQQQQHKPQQQQQQQLYGGQSRAAMGQSPDAPFGAGRASLFGEAQALPTQQAPRSLADDMPPLMEKMIGEIAELRVRNQDLESYVAHLERRLAAYESGAAPQIE
jgi:hypothetical protein